MAKCLGTMNWPCDHAEIHARAARLGWLRRRGYIAMSRSDRAAMDLLKIHRAHIDKSHKGLVRFQEKDSRKWQEMPKRTFDELVQASKEELRGKRKESRQAGIDERMAHAEFRAQRAEINKYIKQEGGIRPNKADAQGKIPELEEWRDLPKQLRVNPKPGLHGHISGLPLDEMAEQVKNKFGIGGSSDDLRRWMREQSQTEQHYRLRKRHFTPEPAPAPAPPPAPPPKPKIIVSQSGGKWIITRLYPDGHVAGQPGTYASQKAAEKAAEEQRRHGGALVKSALFEQGEDAYGHTLFK